MDYKKQLSGNDENVVQFRKSDRFAVYRAGVTGSGELVEQEQLGFAFLKPNGGMFRLKLWMFPNEQYFIAPNEERSEYRVLCPNSYLSNSGEELTRWNVIGHGSIAGAFIKLKLYLLGQEILVSLFPKRSEALSDAA